MPWAAEVVAVQRHTVAQPSGAVAMPSLSATFGEVVRPSGTAVLRPAVSPDAVPWFPVERQYVAQPTAAIAAASIDNMGSRRFVASPMNATFVEPVSTVGYGRPSTATVLEPVQAVSASGFAPRVSSFSQPYGTAPFAMPLGVTQPGYMDLTGFDPGAYIDPTAFIPPIGIPGGFHFAANFASMHGDRGNFGFRTGELSPSHRGGYGQADVYGGYGSMEPPPPSPPRHGQFEEANRYAAMAAEHERQGELMGLHSPSARFPPPAPAEPMGDMGMPLQPPAGVPGTLLERQIEELVQGHEALQREIMEVKGMAMQHYSQLEAVRTEAQHRPKSPAPMPAPPPFDHGYYGPSPPAELSSQAYEGYGLPPTLGPEDDYLPPTQSALLPDMSSRLPSVVHMPQSPQEDTRGPPSNLGYSEAKIGVIGSLKRVADPLQRTIQSMIGGVGDKSSQKGRRDISKSACF